MKARKPKRIVCACIHGTGDSRGYEELAKKVLNLRHVSGDSGTLNGALYRHPDGHDIVITTRAMGRKARGTREGMAPFLTPGEIAESHVIISNSMDPQVLDAWNSHDLIEEAHNAHISGRIIRPPSGDPYFVERLSELVRNEEKK